MTMKSTDDERPGSSRHSRRSFLKGVGLAAGAVAVVPGVSPAQQQPTDPPGLKTFGSAKQEITLSINGAKQKVEVEPRTTLLEALRANLNLTGTKEVCDRGSCGACSVLLDGETICACMMLAIDAIGREVVTIEGIAKDPKYAKLIDSYCEHDAAQCGFCIPGFVVRSAEMLDNNPTPSPEEIKEGLSGNICRCGTYVKIFEAVSAAKGRDIW